jgi:type IV pilus assembly protein PilV
MQLSARRANFEALQRGNASAYAMDIVERMRANSSALSDYALAAGDSPVAGGAENICRTSSCSASELAAYELWNWRQTLLGGDERKEGLPVGGLVSAVPCIRVSGHTVEVVIAWRGLERMSESPESGSCAIGSDDGMEVLVLRGYIGERPDGSR